MIRPVLQRPPARRTAVTVLAAAVALAFPVAGSLAAGSHRTADKPVIALSNSFLGNSWRQTMVKIFEQTAKQAKAKGLISDYKVENTADNTATEQIAQIKSLILQHVDAILIDSASPSALNPTIEQACKAGIKVVVFDSLASAPCEYNLEDSIYQYGYQEGLYVAKGMHGKGNVIVARGVVGSAPEAVIYKGQRDALKKFPKIKIVSTVVGQASNAITQKAIAGVLPSLPSVQGVITGGSSFGAVQAFQAAGRALPVVAFDNSGEGLAFWKKQHAKNGYNAVSLRTEPGQVAAAFWEAMDLLDGKAVPKHLVFPNLVVTPKNLEKWLKVTPPGTVCHYAWTKAQFHKEVARIKAKKSLFIPPVPKKAV
jgi:ribose transport system substrate-binding protein